MAKFVENLAGYDPSMTPEEKVAFFENLEAPAEPAPQQNPAEPKPVKTTTDTISKKRFDEVSHELAAAKKALRARMTDEEARAEEAQQQQQALVEELETLRKEKTLSNHKASFLGLGMAAESADEAANALTEGDYDGVFSALNKHMASAKKAWQAEALKNTPRPPVDEGESAAARAKQAALRKSFGLPD